MSVTLIEGSGRARLRVLIAGGGVAALEALLALAETAGPYVELSLLAPQPRMTYRPLSVAEPFGLTEPREIDLRHIAEERGAKFRLGVLSAIEREQRMAITADGDRITWDVLLVAVGATQTSALPGALSFGGPRDVAAFRALLEDVEGGQIGRLAFVVPKDASWSLPLYELALMTGAHAARRDLALEIAVVTAERRPLEIFGEAVSDHVVHLLEDSHLSLTTGVVAVAAHSGQVILAPSGTVRADRVVALPQLRGPRIAGLPQRKGGFIPVDEFGRVEGSERIYAAGDATWHAIKQGGIAAQQADAAASAIAAAAGAPVAPEPFEPVLRGVLLTGGPPEYLRGPNASGSGASENALWWPPAKVAGRYLAPLLSDTDPNVPLHDGAADHHPALDLALEAANAAVTCSRDYARALDWLDVAERLNIVLPPRYAEKRVRWRAELAARRR